GGAGQRGRRDRAGDRDRHLEVDGGPLRLAHAALAAGDGGDHAAGRVCGRGGRLLSGAARLAARSDRRPAFRIACGEVSPLSEIAAVFLRLGFTAFGGPAAHVALMERELVDRRGWLTRDELVELYGAASLLPGPNSTELAIHIGYRRGGPAGLVLA